MTIQRNNVYNTLRPEPPSNPELYRIGNEIIDSLKFCIHSSLANIKITPNNQLQKSFIRYAKTRRPASLRKAVLISRALDERIKRKQIFLRSYSAKMDRVAKQGFAAVKDSVAPLKLDKLFRSRGLTIGTIKRKSPTKLANFLGM